MKVVLDQGMLYLIAEHADEEGALDLIADRALETHDNEIVVVNQGTVAMSPQHARSLANILVRNLKLYESQFGKIPHSSREGES